MRIVKYVKYGSPEVVTVIDKEKPSAAADEMIIRVETVGVSPAECAFRSADPFITRLFGGFFAPKAVPGDYFAGVVEETGAELTHLKKGDRVFGTTGAKMGAHSQYAVLKKDDAVVALPEELDFYEGSAIADGGITALPFLRDSGKIQEGQHVLINGASGSIGTYAVQICKIYGAEVTAVCSSKNHELVKSLGADHVIDYHKVDFTKNDNTYDIVFDTVGKSSFKASKASLTENGIYLTTVPAVPEMMRTLFVKKDTGKRAVFSATGLRKASDKLPDFKWLADQAVAGKLKTVQDKVYSLDDIVEAHHYVDKGHKVGNITVNMW